MKKDDVRILYAEDDQFGANKFIEFMNRKGFPLITHVENGAHTISFLRRQEFDLVISDNQMPLMSGIESLERLRDNGNIIPFILMTSDDSIKLKEQVESLNAVYLPKRTDLGAKLELFEKIVAAIEPQSQQINFAPQP